MKLISIGARIGSILAPLLVAACGPPPGLEGAWRQMEALRAPYETCQRQNAHQSAVCAQKEAAYRAAVASYHAQLDTRQSGGAR